MVGTITPETRIIDLTVGQLMDLIAKAQAPVVEKNRSKRNALCMEFPGLHNCSIAA